MMALCLVLHPDDFPCSKGYPRIVVIIFVLLLKKREKRRQLQGSGGSFDLDMENILEDSVMCRVRAKRGCATHPRSIAERVLK